MTVVLDISMSLDGFVTGPGPGIANGLGDGGAAVHEWAMGANSAADRALLARTVAETGAVVLGRRTFDIVDGPHGWGDERGFGGPATGVPRPPNFVVTHQVPDQVRLTNAFTFVTTGVADAVDQARAAAGDKDVSVMGGASIIRQCLDADLADELRVHLAPVLLGTGTPLFDRQHPRPLRLLPLQESAHATHLRYALR
jgi:dihydrofolate reductase